MSDPRPAAAPTPPTRLVNTWSQLKAAVAEGTIPKRQAVAVSYHAKPPGRLGYARPFEALVWSPFAVYPTSDRRDHGAKAFIPHGHDWRAAVEGAKQWAGAKYGITEWARNRMGDYVPVIVNKRHPLPKREK